MTNPPTPDPPSMSDEQRQAAASLAADAQVAHIPGQLRLIGEEGSLSLADALARVRDLEQEQRVGRDSSLAVVRSAATARRSADAGLDQAVAEARAWGATWQQIADAAGVTRQTAWKRWGIR